MQTKMCTVATWTLVLLAVLLLLFQGRMSLLAVVIPISLLLARAMVWSGNTHTKLTRDGEKR